MSGVPSIQELDKVFEKKGQTKLSRATSARKKIGEIIEEILSEKPHKPQDLMKKLEDNGVQFGTRRQAKDTVKSYKKLIEDGKLKYHEIPGQVKLDHFNWMIDNIIQKQEANSKSRYSLPSKELRSVTIEGQNWLYVK